MINLINRGGFYVNVSVDLPLTLEQKLDKLVYKMVEAGAIKTEMMSISREQNPKTWRQIAMWYARVNNWGTFKAIGFYFKRDHSTVINAYNYVSDLIEANDKDIMNKLNKLGIKTK